MPVVAADFGYYLGASIPEDDASAVGGAVQDPASAGGARIPILADISGLDFIECLSDGADTRTMPTAYRRSSGLIVSDTIQLAGTSVQQTSIQAERFMKAELSAKDAARTVTLRKASDDVTIAVLKPNFRSVHRMFYGAVSAGTQKVLYEGFYVQNDNATAAALSAAITLISDPIGRLKMGLAAAKGNITAAANRLTAPGGVSFVDDNVPVNVPGGSLGPGERIWVWLELTLAAAAAAAKSSWQVRVDFSTT